MESHPLADMLDVRNQKLEMAYSYFFNQTPYTVTDDGSYADRDAVMKNKTTHEWAHSISEIMQSLWSAGLTIQTFEEYPYCFYEKFGGMMEKNEDGWWVFKDESWKGKLPLMFSMTAKKTNN